MRRNSNWSGNILEHSNWGERKTSQCKLSGGKRIIFHVRDRIS